MFIRYFERARPKVLSYLHRVALVDHFLYIGFSLLIRHTAFALLKQRELLCHAPPPPCPPKVQLTTIIGSKVYECLRLLLAELLVYAKSLGDGVQISINYARQHNAQARLRPGWPAWPFGQGEVRLDCRRRRRGRRSCGSMSAEKRGRQVFPSHTFLVRTRFNKHWTLGRKSA
jgi:hypothetical protein